MRIPAGKSAEIVRSGEPTEQIKAPGPRAQANATLWPHIEQACQASRQTYGSTRSTRSRQRLRRHGQTCSHHRVARLMRGYRMQSQSKRCCLAALTDSHHDAPARRLSTQSGQGHYFAG